MTSINSNTKISTLIKTNQQCIEAIAGIAPPLAKLRNPVLRKILASRVTIAEAAKMGGCSVNDFERVLSPLGFTFEDLVAEKSDGAQKPKPTWLEQKAAHQIIILNVTDRLASGKDPLREITTQFKNLKDGQVLCIINSFEPVPLIRLLEKERVQSFTQKVSGDEFHTWFLKSNVGHENKNACGNIINDSQSDFQLLLEKFNNNIELIDVRHLEMPQPMQSILAALKNLPSGEALHVLHKKVPVYLLEHLSDSDYFIHILSVGEGDVQLLIYKHDG